MLRAAIEEGELQGATLLGAEFRERLGEQIAAFGVLVWRWLQAVIAGKIVGQPTARPVPGTGGQTVTPPPLETRAPSIVANTPPSSNGNASTGAAGTTTTPTIADPSSSAATTSERTPDLEP